MKPTNEGSEAAERGRLALEASSIWQAIRTAFLASGDAAAAQSAITRITEAAAVESFDESPARTPSPMGALFAVGGFARGTLYPYSHPDILVVRESDRRAPGESGAGFAGRLRARGVLPSLRVVTSAECVALLDRSPDLARKLLDRRLLAGDTALAASFERDLDAAFAQRGGALAERLTVEARARHRKYLDTPSHREPDAEETPGGGRDLNLLAALGRLRPGLASVAAPPSLSAPFFALVRCFLHFRAGEDRNLLDLAAQQAIVAQFAPAAPLADWMREYFRHARAVFHALRRTLDECLPETSPAPEVSADPPFRVERGRVGFRDPSAAGPEDSARLIEFIARSGVPPSPEVAAALSARPPVPLSWPALKATLSQPHAGSALRALQAAEALPAALPEWTRIEGLADGDPDRTLTLDEHSLKAVEHLCALHGTADAGARRFAELLPDAEGRSLTVFALLFHHMGESAAAAAARVGIPDAGRELVAFLVESRAGLFDLLGGRDLDDPATIRLAAERAGTVERLAALTLTTYADLCATYSEPILLWRLDQLWRAYLATRRELTRELESDRIQQIPAALAGSSDFVTGFPTRYLRSRSAAEIRGHVRLYEQCAATGVAVELEPVGGAYRLTVVAQDRPALFASFAGAISSFGLDIVQAEAFSNSKGVILDTFVVADPRRTLSLNPPEAERLRDLIGRIAQGKTDARRLFRNRPQAAVGKDAMDPRVQFDSEACDTATLVEIVAEDRPGLLYSLASVFSGNHCDIDTVLIDTKGRSAIDVFYVAHQGAKLSPELQADLQRQLIAACVGTNPAK
ncbi:MAG: hypothetical protein JST11_18095 [Acidobacteria bacterium]|nr:hypothetical protein [Acidobacteriota bacterium]